MTAGLDAVPFAPVASPSPDLMVKRAPLAGNRGP